MFIGKNIQSIDAKGRINVPAKFREVLNSKFTEKLILTSYNNEYITTYPMEEWLVYQEKIKNLSTSQKEIRDFIRIIFSRACECTLDSHGRILIPASLRELAGISKEVLMIGINNRIEIWDVKKFEEYERKTTESIGDVPEKLGEIGFT